MRFLHVADVHLDTPFAGRSDELRRRLRDASRQALRRAVDWALEEEVHAVLVAGDLFDGERLSFATERFLLQELRRLDGAGIQVVYATGNHDPGDAGGRVRALDWPANVTVVGSAEPRRIRVTDRAGDTVGHVTAAGHASSREARDLAATFPPPPGPLPEVALLHTQVVGSQGADAHGRYAPSELATLRAADYDYWALGHVHRRQRLSRDPPIHYPGNPQGRTPRERGPKGALLVEMEPDGRAEVRFRELGPIRWERLRVDDLEEARNLEELEEAVRVRWNEARSGDPPAAPGRTDWIVRVVLSGGTPLWRELESGENLRILADELEAVLGVLAAEVRAERTHPVVDVEAHRERSDVVGEVLELLDRVRSGETTLDGTSPEELAGVSDADGDDAAPAYARELLRDAGEELLARLLAGARGAGNGEG